MQIFYKFFNKINEIAQAVFAAKLVNKVITYIHGLTVVKMICFGIPTEAPAKADLRNKFRYCCGGSAIRASSIALAFGRSWGWVKTGYDAGGGEARGTD